MPLDTEVKGDPEALDATCDWIRGQSREASATGDQVYAARSDSEAGWAQQAGDAARGVMTQAGKMVDTLTGELDSTCRELQTHSDDLRTVGRQMERARAVAREGGITVNGFTIEEPGPKPAAPEELPEHRQPTPSEKQAHAAATEVQAAFQKKVQAYEEASHIVEEARKKETDSQHVLTRFFSSVFDAPKLALSLVDMTGGGLAAVATRTSAYREFAEECMTKAERASKVANSTNLSFAHRMKASAIEITNDVNAKAAQEQALATRTARAIDKWSVVRKTAEGLDTKVVPRVPNTGNAVLRGAARVGSKIPGLGLVLTGAGVGIDIERGKDPTQAVVSGGSSFAVGTAVGAAVGGPVGVVAGGLVGMGVGFLVDEVWPD